MFETIINTLVDDIITKSSHIFSTESDATNHGLFEFMNNPLVLSVRVYVHDKTPKQLVDCNRTPFFVN